MLNASVVARTMWISTGISEQLNVKCFIGTDNKEPKMYALQTYFVTDPSRPFKDSVSILVFVRR